MTVLNRASNLYAQAGEISLLLLLLLLAMILMAVVMLASLLPRT